MHRTVPLPEATPFTWVDLVDPKAAEIRDLSAAYGLPGQVVRDFLNQPHLPKIERFPEGLLVIVRAFDEGARGGDTYQALTRRLVVFLKEGTFFTLRRKDQPFAALVVEKATAPGAAAPRQEDLLRWLLGGAIHSHEEPLRLAEEELDRIEDALLEGRRPPKDLGRIYRIKRRCAVIKRVLGRTVVMLKELATQHPDEGGFLADLQEETDRLHAWADELLEGATHLMTLQLNLQGQRTNEVMRVLTLFSAFFLPLTFIAGVYGMNFDRMPELRHPHGYAYTLTAMAGVTALIYFWFRKQGWLK